MSELAIAAVMGPANRNSGRPRYADVVAHLFVGGSGLWQVHRLGAGRSEATAPTRIRIRAGGETAIELAAGFALATGIDAAVALVEKHLGTSWQEQEVDLDSAALGELAQLVMGLEVALVVTHLDAGPGAADDLLGLPWSVVVATAIAQARSTQWS